MIIKFWYL
jgi:hypothetical protein